VQTGAEKRVSCGVEEMARGATKGATSNADTPSSRSAHAAAARNIGYGDVDRGSRYGSQLRDYQQLQPV
jgi:hypothetical protein